MGESMKTWEECYQDPVGTAYVDETIEAVGNDGLVSVRGLILRAPYALAAYVGVGLDHPTAGWPYEVVPLEVHGGLTYSAAGDDDGPWPQGWWWYGWDYAHAFDATYVRRELAARGSPLPPRRGTIEETQWDPDMILPELRLAAQELLVLAQQFWQPAPEVLAEHEESHRRMAEALADFRAGRLPSWLKSPDRQ